MLMNKSAIACWNILKYEIESIIDKFVPLKKQGKRSRKKHLSKEAIRKIVFKQTLWRVYRRTRKDEDYANYKEALNLATTETRKSKRSYEQKKQQGKHNFRRVSNGSSVFTTEDIGSLPVPCTKFEGNKSEHLGQLFVTPEIIANKTKKMKDNKSPRVDGIPPKLLKEIVEQFNTPLPNFLTCH